MERPLKRIPNPLQQSRRQQRLKPDQSTAVLQILEAVILEIATVEHLEVAIPEIATVEHLEAAIPEIATVEHLEVAILEIATVERLEVATAEAIIPEAARVEAQHRVVTAEVVEVPIMEVLHQVQTLEATTVEIQVQMERCQFRIMPFLEIRHLVIIQEQVEMAEEIPQMDRILIFDDATPDVKEAEYV